MRELPTGTVTFLFTDIEGSTKLLLRVEAGCRTVDGQCRADADACNDRGDGEHHTCPGGFSCGARRSWFILAFPSTAGAVFAHKSRSG
jgi:hypothetical protein